MADVRGHHARAVVISVACCQSRDSLRTEGRLTSLVRDFPRVTALALLGEPTNAAPAAILLLGRSGFRIVVDTRCADGWRTLREALAERSTAGDIVTTAISQVGEDLREARAECRRFFTTLFAVDESVVRVQQLGCLFAVAPSTLISRFARAGLPSPKTYLSWARLVKAAALLENPGVSFAAAATALEYSSPQALSRHLSQLLGLGVPAFRQSYDGGRMLARFRSELVLRYVGVLTPFSPLSGPRRGIR